MLINKNNNHRSTCNTKYCMSLGLLHLNENNNELHRYKILFELLACKNCVCRHAMTIFTIP